MGRASRARLRLLAVGVAVALSACHRYIPIETAVPGTIVRVHVPVTTALADPNAPVPSVSIEGSVLAAGDTLVLATQTRREFGAFREVILFDTVRLAEDQRAGMELQEFSMGRSIALGALITGGAAALAAAAFGARTGSGGNEPPPPQPVPAIVVSGSILSAIWGLIGN